VTSNEEVMHRTPICRRLPVAGALAALAFLAALAHAAPPPAPASAGPSPAPGLPAALDPQAAVPALVYRSSLADHRRLGNDAPVPWPEAIATVGRIGGWRAYLREASEPAPEMAPAPASRPASAAAPPSVPVPQRPAPADHHKH
jgi:hypothetical protein